MLKHNFVRLIKDLSHRFKFYAAPDKYTNSSLWFLSNDGCVQNLVCAVPSGDIPEYSVINKDEFVRDRGWRAILRIISDKKINGRSMVSREHFWKVLHKHGIWHIDQAIQYETAWGNFSDKKTTRYEDYHK